MLDNKIFYSLGSDIVIQILNIPRYNYSTSSLIFTQAIGKENYVIEYINSSADEVDLQYHNDVFISYTKYGISYGRFASVNVFSLNYVDFKEYPSWATNNTYDISTGVFKFSGTFQPGNYRIIAW